MDDEKWTKPDDEKGLALADLKAFYEDMKDGMMIETPCIYLEPPMVKMEDSQSTEALKFSAMVRKALLLHEK